MLIDALRARLPGASSFQLVGEDLSLLTLDDVRAAVERQHVAIPAGIRDALLAEEAMLATQAQAWLRKYNRSLYGRIAGYLALGERLAFRYPWPVVAILGIVQVLGGMDRARLYGLAGRLASRFGIDRYERLGDGSEDVLRRTNRGIFADSVPLVLRALRASEIADPQLANALVDGTAALLYDEESRALCRLIVDGLAIVDPVAQFRALADATLTHFAREQAIFTHHISSKVPAPGATRSKLPTATSLPAPVVEAGALAFKPFKLPPGFDFRDHATRVEVFGRAYVSSVTRTPDEYGVATAWVRTKFRRK